MRLLCRGQLSKRPKPKRCATRALLLLVGEARTLGRKDPRSTARMVLQNGLVDGRVVDVKFSCMAASATVWLLSTHETKLPIGDFHYVGYDISNVPGPLDQARMFNFRAILSESPEQAALSYRVSCHYRVGDHRRPPTEAALIRPKDGPWLNFRFP